MTDLKARAMQSRDVIELLASKWRITVLHLLREGPLRTRELQAAMDGISAKVLTQTLRGMERDGLVGRKVFPVAPPRVEYKLTALGSSALTPLRELCLWAEKNAAQRDRARKQFDAASTTGEL